MANIISNWMNSNELRKFPVDARYACEIPDDFIADMQIFVPAPRNRQVESDSPIVNISQITPSTGFPYIASAAATKYLVTVVVKCPGCTLFCTKSRDSFAPYSPVEFVSENGTCSGWVSFGAIDPSVTFSFTGGDSDKGRLDWRAVVFYPSSTIGGLSIPALSSKVSGDVKIVAGTGMSVSSDPETNSLKLALDKELKTLYMDPCFTDSPAAEFPDICSINGLSSDEGSIVLAFTGDKISKATAAMLQNNVKSYIGSSAAEYAKVTSYSDNIVSVNLSNSAFSNYSTVAMAIPVGPGSVINAEGTVAGQQCSIIFTPSQSVKFPRGQYVFVHSLIDLEAPPAMAEVRRMPGTKFNGVMLDDGTGFRNMEAVLVVLVSCPEGTYDPSDCTELETRDICTVTTYGRAKAEVRVSTPVAVGTPVVIFDPQSFVVVSADAKTTKISDAVYDDTVKVLVRSFQGSFSIVGYRLVYDLVDPESFGLSRRYLEFSTGSGYHFPEYDVYTRPECLPPLAELYRNIKVANGSEELWFPDFNEAENHGYEACHISSNRYYVETDAHDNQTIKALAPVQPSNGDAPADDPFAYDEPIDVDYSTPGKTFVLFSHRFRRSIDFSNIVGVYVEIVYKRTDNTSDFVVRRPVKFSDA